MDQIQERKEMADAAIKQIRKDLEKDNEAALHTLLMSCPAYIVNSFLKRG